MNPNRSRCQPCNPRRCIFAGHSLSFGSAATGTACHHCLGIGGSGAACGSAPSRRTGHKCPSRSNRKTCNQGVGPQAWVSCRVPSHGLPPAAAGCATVRRRNLWPSALQPDQWLQSLKVHGIGSATQVVLQACSSLRLPAQAAPRPRAGLTTWRARCCQPLPHEAWQVPQSDQVDITQGSDKMALQAPVSAKIPVHGFPPLVGSCFTFRLRYFCVLYDEFPHADHDCQSDKTQSLGSQQVVLHLFVLNTAPAQGTPHSLFTLAMVRCLWQRPSQLGSSQSLHEPNLQSMGWHGG